VAERRAVNAIRKLSFPQHISSGLFPFATRALQAHAQNIKRLFGREFSISSKWLLDWLVMRRWESPVNCSSDPTPHESCSFRL